MSTARLGTFDDLLSERADSSEVAAIARRLREMIFEVLPDATEVVRLGDGATSLGLGEKKMSEAAVYVMPLTDRVNLGFYHGAGLDESADLLHALVAWRLPSHGDEDGRGDSETEEPNVGGE